MAHVGQELRLHDVGGVGDVAGLGERSQGAVKRRVVGLQFRQQGVEPLGEPAELVGAGGLDHDREVLGAAHLLHAPGQPTQWLENAARQPVRHQPGHQCAEHKQPEPDHDIALEVPFDVVLSRYQHQFADVLVFAAEHRCVHLEDAMMILCGCA